MKTELSGWNPLDVAKSVVGAVVSPFTSTTKAATALTVKAVQSAPLKKVIEQTLPIATNVVLPTIQSPVLSTVQAVIKQTAPQVIKYAVPKSIDPPPPPTATIQTVEDETTEKTPVEELISLVPLGDLALFAFAL